jgi:hypothetical protein
MKTRGYPDNAVLSSNINFERTHNYENNLALLDISTFKMQDRKTILSPDDSQFQVGLFLLAELRVNVTVHNIK